MTTATLIPAPPVDEPEWSGDEEAFLVLVARRAHDSGEIGPAPFTMSPPGAENTLVVFTGREMAEQFVASPWFEEYGLVKGMPAEAFIKVLSICVKSGLAERILVNPNPLHEWEEGNIQGELADAGEILEDLREVYRDFLDD